MIWKPRDIFSLFSQMRNAGLTMRHRFAIYLLSLSTGFLALLLIVLNLFGVLNLVDSRLEHAIDIELENSAFALERDMDQIAAYALSLSDQLSDETERFLSRQNIVFDDLKDNVDLLEELQLENFSIIYTYLRLANCSGAFYFMDTTVNSSLPTQYHNGVYLRLANFHSESITNQQFSMIFGSTSTAIKTDTDLYTTW